MICSHNQPNKKININKIDLSQERKAQLIKQFRNFPHITLSKDELQRKKQIGILSQIYPWGCAKLNQKVQFTDYDRTYEIWFPDYSNICISLKYGICPFFKLQNLKFIYQQWKKYNEQGRNGSIYLRLVDKDKIYAIVRLVNLRIDVSFRFWYVINGMSYPIGLGFIEAISVGQISRSINFDFSSRSLKRICRQLRDNQLDWGKFIASDDYEWRGRMKYIISIKDGQFPNFQHKVEERSKQVIEQLQK